jgi:hypothetical protein
MPSTITKSNERIYIPDLNLVFQLFILHYQRSLAQNILHSSVLQLSWEYFDWGRTEQRNGAKNNVHRAGENLIV